MTLTTMPGIRRAHLGVLYLIAGLIAHAGRDLPAPRWLIPDRAVREDMMHNHTTILVEHTLLHGQVDILCDESAVAVWYDRSQPVPPPPDYDRRRDVACGRYSELFADLDALQAHKLPSTPHDHLAYLAVAPYLQRTGRGSALLHHHHRQLDEAGVPAYLQTDNDDNALFFTRFRYQTASSFGLLAGPQFWPMTRAAQVPDA